MCYDAGLKPKVDWFTVSLLALAFLAMMFSVTQCVPVKQEVPSHVITAE